jgi:hypothetical protein
MLGRISAVNQIFIGSSNELGAFESGVAARLLGTVASVVVGGAVTIGVALVTNWVFPALARLDTFTDYEAAAEPARSSAETAAAGAITPAPPSAPS